ncbi:MAG TPA: division/cell wall cluster transcriptional repressor MraZ [Chloroflexi bacterium]|jgi:MraZ protein|nr:division/cell wall cluster transcriptional repressor MraZ [Chloroflexota bacterium]
MFVGEYSHTLDTKGRLTIPARFRAELESGMVITRGAEPCLVVYPADEWAALAAKAAQMPTASRVARSYSRLIFGGASEAQPDKMGRILIPAFLREYAGIQEEAVVVGVNSYVEIWSPERWRETLEQDAADLDEILAEVAKMGI